MKSQLKKIEGIIGLEVHAYLVTSEKLFCQCKASREKSLLPNINICPICTGQPGAKPMLPNKIAVKKTVQIAVMLGCKINEYMLWQRKHYDWPDLPKGYQNTLSGSHAAPIGENGKFYNISIKSMHLEEDPASWNPETGEVDYNRSGLPLVEIVTSPEFKTAEEVITWLKKLLHSFSYLKCVDANAGIKVDVNVNIPKKTERVEIKNISSLESIKKAIEYELKRHATEKVSKQETRRYDDLKGRTILMRTKETQDDYRFISDPDLVPLIINKEFIKNQEKSLPESPEQKLKKIISIYKIDKKNAEILAKNIDIIEFFEKVAEEIDPKFAIPWVTGELLRLINENKTTLDKIDINPTHFAALLNLVKNNSITPLKAKEILKKFYPKSFQPETERKMTNPAEIEKVAKEVIAKNTSAVESYKKGEKNAINFLMGEIMKITKKRADFKISRECLEKLLR